jgi:adenylate cyclase class 2
MYEVEMKVRAAHEDVRRELDATDATPLGSVTQRDVYFDAPHRDFAARDEALRLREETDAEGTTAVLTYKGPRLDEQAKTRAEHETAVADPNALERALEALGFSPAATVEKHRERFSLDGFTISLDAVEGLGEFVEVERGATDGEVSDAQAAVADQVERLGLDPDEQISQSYLELCLEEAAETGDARGA